jgi:hypothetical protein
VNSVFPCVRTFVLSLAFVLSCFPSAPDYRPAQAMEG